MCPRHLYRTRTKRVLADRLLSRGRLLALASAVLISVLAVFSRQSGLLWDKGWNRTFSPLQGRSTSPALRTALLPVEEPRPSVIYTQETAETRIIVESSHSSSDDKTGSSKSSNRGTSCQCVRLCLACPVYRICFGGSLAPRRLSHS